MGGLVGALTDKRMLSIITDSIDHMIGCPSVSLEQASKSPGGQMDRWTGRGEKRAMGG